MIGTLERQRIGPAQRCIDLATPDRRQLRHDRRVVLAIMLDEMRLVLGRAFVTHEIANRNRCGGWIRFPGSGDRFAENDLVPDPPVMGRRSMEVQECARQILAAQRRFGRDDSREPDLGNECRTGAVI